MYTVQHSVNMAATAAVLLSMVSSHGCAAQSLKRETSNAQMSSLAGQNPALTDPLLANKQAPEKFLVRMKTTKGDIDIEVNRDWSPNGADRFYNMVDIGYFQDIAIFRAVPNFMFQFGVHGNPEVSNHWSESNIQDDPSAGVSNLPGYITFAKTGMPNSRSVQMFINLGNNSFLDAQGFTPFGKVVKGMDVVKKINTEYGENNPADNVQGNLVSKGNAWLLDRFKRLDLIQSVEIVE